MHKLLDFSLSFKNHEKMMTKMTITMTFVVIHFGNVNVDDVQALGKTSVGDANGVS